MTEHMSTKEYLAMQAKPKASKYKNKKIKIDNITFDSLAEGAYYEYLKSLKEFGEVSYFLMQVPFECGGGVKYRLDFQVHYTDGRIENIDIKGAVNQVFVNKKKQVESRYPIKIRCVFKKGNRFVEREV